MFILLNQSFSAPEGFSRDSMLSFINRSDYEGAKTFLLSKKDLVLESNDSIQVRWYSYLGSVESLLEEYDDSFISLLKALEIASNSNNLDLIVNAKTNLLELYRKLRLYEDAFPLIHETMPVLDLLPFETQCFFLNRAAAIYNEYNYKNELQEYLDTAEIYSKMALNIAIENNFISHQATCYNELGNIYEKSNRLDRARETYDLAIQLVFQKDTLNLANSIKNKGSYFLRTKEYDSAIYYFNKVLRLVHPKNELRLKSDSYWGLKMAYKEIGDSVNFFKSGYLESHYNTLETERLLDNKIHELSKAYETERKDILLAASKKSIEVEKRQNQVSIIISLLLIIIIAILGLTYFNIRTKNKKLRKLITENEFLVGESNHRIKNNLQLIISLIGREIYKSNEMKQDLVEISDKINSIAALHQHLYINESKETVNVKSYILSIIENFNHLNYFEGIELNVSLVEFELQIDKAVYLGLLVTELFTNSIKHAFPSGFKRRKFIQILMKQDQGAFTLVFKDNGVGLKKEFDPSLVRLLLKQLGANKTASKEGGYVLNLKIDL